MSKRIFFIDKSKKIHGDKYDYSKVTYKNANSKICIICPEHGEFLTTPKKHLKGEGCPKCDKRTFKQRQLIKKFKEKHGDKYDYSKFIFIKMKEKSCIICPKHGEFLQTPEKHLLGRGCPICANKKRNEKRVLKLEDFIKRADKIHNGFYDYSKTEFENEHSKAVIICPVHGEFKQTIADHLHGSGCKQCAVEKQRMTTEEFIDKATIIHGGKYDYCESKVTKTKDHVDIICPIHGKYKQKVESHLKGSGCPKCGKVKSNGEDLLYEFICGLIGKDKVERRNRKILPNNKELDIYISSKRLAIEYNGVYWHSEKFGKGQNYHLDKLNECNKKHIKLIQIFEDEFFDHTDIVYSKIRHALGKSEGLTKIYARKCQIKQIKPEAAQKFLINNHIEGYVRSTVHLGCFYKKKLVAVSSFKKEKNDWSLARFASDINKLCIGMCGKMLKYFIKEYKPSCIKAFADKRWTTDINHNLFTKVGFRIDKTIKPDYKYIKKGGYKRLHKSNYKKKILSKKYDYPMTMTEKEMCNKLGMERIWDCGLVKYKLVVQ